MLFRPFVVLACALPIGTAGFAAAGEEGDTYEVNVLPGFPPLSNIDDTHPPDLGTFELNELAMGDVARSGPRMVKGPYLDFNYGTQFWIFKNLQLKAEGGYGWLKPDKSSPFQAGMSNFLFGVKWMFFSNEDEEARGAFSNWTLGTYPQVSIAPSASAVRRDLAEGGRRYTFPLLATKTVYAGRRPVGFTVNIFGEHGGAEPDDIGWSIGAGTAVSRRIAAMTSFSDETSLISGPNKIVQAQFGIVRSISSRFNIYGMTGRIFNVADNIDGKAHIVWCLGVQVIAGSKAE